MSESWERAMRLAAEDFQRDFLRRRVWGYRYGSGWAYAVTKGRRKHVEQTELFMTKELFAALTDSLPRCAQRARTFHGGNSKIAIPDARTARAMGAFAGQRHYLCDLPSPAIGPHWHLATTKKWKARG